MKKDHMSVFCYFYPAHESGAISAISRGPMDYSVNVYDIVFTGSLLTQIKENILEFFFALFK